MLSIDRVPKCNGGTSYKMHTFCCHKNTTVEVKAGLATANPADHKTHKEMIMSKTQKPHYRSTTLIIVSGLVALASLWVLGSSNCGSLNLKLSLSLDLQLNKEVCKLPDK